jgi:excisionase family DNA binding protein
MRPGRWHRRAAAALWWGLAAASVAAQPNGAADAVLTLEEAASFLRVPPSALESLAQSGEVSARRIAGQWRFSRLALLRWLSHDEPLKLTSTPALSLPAAAAAASAAAGRTVIGPPELARVAGRQAQPMDTPAPAQGPAAVGERRTAPTAEQVALRDQGTLLPGGRITTEFGLTYSRAERPFGLPGDRIEQNALEPSLGLRYGLLDGLQVSASLPGRYVRTAFVAVPGGPVDSQRESRFRWGDPTLALLGVAATEGPWRPTVLWNLQAVVPGGGGGAGDAGIGAGLTFTKSSDPAILFGGLSYVRGLRVDPDNAERSLAKHNVSFKLGYAVALNDALALTGQLSGTYGTYRAPTGGAPPPRERYQLRLGVTQVLTPRLYVEPTVSIGLGGDSPDFSLGLSIPYSF